MLILSPTCSACQKVVSVLLLPLMTTDTSTIIYQMNRSNNAAGHDITFKIQRNPRNPNAPWKWHLQPCFIPGAPLTASMALLLATQQVWSTVAVRRFEPVVYGCFVCIKLSFLISEL
mmetsp:Transcript_24048/g.45988  ORF Transcript_24048/g.45988 Transcript_24048/m.45988 type:complete len:117 (+) Transcript_24048:2172-2522(+)